MDDYRKRLKAYQDSEAFRKELAETDRPYDPKKMESRIPLGCTLGIIVALAAIAFIIIGWLRHYAGK